MTGAHQPDIPSDGPRPPGAWHLYARLLGEARSCRGLIVLTALMYLALTPLKLLAPVPAAIAIDCVLGSRPLPPAARWLIPPAWTAQDGRLLLAAVGLLLLVGLLTYGVAMALRLLHSYVGLKLTLAFRARLFRHAQRLSLQFHDHRGSNDSIYRIQYDAPSIQWVALDGIIPFVSAVLTLVSMVFVIAQLSWRIALVALAVAPALFLLTHLWGGRLRRQWQDAKALESSAMGVIHETVGSLRVVKAFGREEREHGRFVQRATRGLRGHLRVTVSQGTFELISGVLVTAGSAAVLYLAVHEALGGRLSVGALWLIWAYLAQLYGPLQTISSKITTLQAALASAERAFRLLDEAPDVIDRPGARALVRARGGLAFEHVWFAYAADQHVLKDIHVDIPAGARVGIMGETGAGKSTMMNLLARFHDPARGRILLDGVDLRDYRLADLRDQFAIVLQDPLLFATTIAENIAYARADATQEQIIAAARAANADAFINDLAGGYDTIVGERGQTLSGGQRQRIALARAFLKDAPILILDEPTSAVDTDTEALIIEAMRRLMAGRTTFLIAHRPSTLRCCNMRLEIKSGRLVQIRHGGEAAPTDAPGATALEAKRP